MTINCNGQLIDFSTPKVMGILNITPDSFFDGGKFTSIDKILAQVDQMLRNGADFIDIGAYSSKPQANLVTENEELERLLPMLRAVVTHFPKAILSIDTFRANVAEQSILAGAHIINDISAGSLDPLMYEIIAKHKVPYIMMHMRGTPQTMVDLTDYHDITFEVIQYFAEKVAKARHLGITDLIIDPGFGFAKTIDQNFELLCKLQSLDVLELPILAGISRKSMIYKTLGVSPQEALNGTTALHMTALMSGAHILRVHDINEAVECIKLYQKLKHYKV